MEPDLNASQGPLYARIAASVKLRVVRGELRPGERLPTVRELAASLGINPNTVSRAYALLEQDGVVRSRPGSGTFVAEASDAPGMDADRARRLHSVLQRAVVDGLGLGYRLDQVEAAFEAVLAAWRGGSASSTVVRFAGSHEPALEFLWALAGRTSPALRVESDVVGSLWGLAALERGEADLAGSHLFDPDSGEHNVPWVRSILPGRRVTLLRVAGRQQGIIYRHAHPVESIGQLAGGRLRLVNRQRGSGTRVLLDHELRRLGIPADTIPGYEHEVNTHSEVAAEVARGAADVGVGVLSAARAFELGFSPITTEQYDLVALTETVETGRLDAIVSALRSTEFTALLDSLGGYDSSRTGEAVEMYT